jgi:hypothetical protein
LAYLDVYWVPMLIAPAAIPLAAALRKVKLEDATHMAQ